MKRRTTPIIPVRFNKISVDDIEKIEFLFRQERSEDSEPRVLKTYPTDVEYDAQRDRYMVPWTEEETALFEEDHEFFMDTRITLKGQGAIPETNMVKLFMNGTLFEDNEEGS